MNDHRHRPRAARGRAHPARAHARCACNPATGSAWSGRNGAGKTTSAAGARRRRRCRTPAGSSAVGPVGYLPQDPRTGDLDRASPATGCCPPAASTPWSPTSPRSRCSWPRRPTTTALVRRYGRLEERFTALGGYAAESEAARICANLGLPDRVLAQPLGTLSGGQRRRVELARILFADSGGEPTTLLLDEPTNHLDADSITWLRDFLRQHTGGLVVISHDVGLLDAVVNKVWYLDANRAVARRLQRRLEDLPAAARDRRAPPAPRAGQRRAQDRGAAQRRPTRCGPRRRRPAPRTRWTAGPPRSRPAWPRCGRRTRWPGCASRRRRRADARR